MVLSRGFLAAGDHVIWKRASSAIEWIMNAGPTWADDAGTRTRQPSCTSGSLARLRRTPSDCHRT
jgi:hypothetical protein